VDELPDIKHITPPKKEEELILEKIHEEKRVEQLEFNALVLYTTP
jgi:hypothetical protein